MRTWILAAAAIVVPMAAARVGFAQQDVPEFTALLEDEDEVMKSEMADAEEGDRKRFTVVTDDNIEALEVGDIYKSNASFFKVVEIPSQGAGGGRFVVERTAGRVQ